MPEYLAPGVYVEETSFRAKSIEGVGTSTTGFVGPTLKGPIGDTPELVTSFGDFERVYGGFSDLALGGSPSPNYLAHAVQNYFDNGGARLYVARVYQAPAGSDGVARSARIGDGTDDNTRIRFVARFPGAVGNGSITVERVETTATATGMNRAPQGTMLRVSQVAAGPARVTGGTGPFSVPDGGTLSLSVVSDGGAPATVDVTFSGQPAEATADQDLADPVNLDAASRTLTVNFGERDQQVRLPIGATPRAGIVAALNADLVGGYARLAGDRLVIGSERRGSAARVTVTANAALGFDADQTVANAPDGANNVADLFAVGAEEIGALLGAASGGAVTASTSSLTGRLIVATTATGSDSTVQVTPGADSVHLVLGLDTDAHAGTPERTDALYVKGGDTWSDSAGTALGDAPAGAAHFVSANVLTRDGEGNESFYEDLGLAPGHPRDMAQVLSERPSRRIDALEHLFALETLPAGVTPFRLYQVLFGTDARQVITLASGSDGVEPASAAYKAGFLQLEKLDDISIVAAPGYSSMSEWDGIQNEILIHVERERAYRIGVLDARPELSIGEVRQDRARIDSTYGAFYYPWVVTPNPLARPGNDAIAREITLPPSGFVCGIYARNDVQRGVHKAPANEVVRGALRFESDVSFAEQQVLNPVGVNCLRFFPGRGYRLWGARTASSDPEWKYVNVRRYFLYLENSIDRGTQWAVFENNGERLWANVRETIASFLYNEWISGALLGSSPEEAFFVRCDRSTMTQNDLDNGRLICLIGVAALKPAEFVIFRIGQKTADARA